MARPQIEGYILYNELGSGACGTVYRAVKPTRDLASSPEECAIKVYGGARATERFRHEREFLRAVRGHPNVVELLASCEGTPNALVLPLYRGLALDSLVRQCNDFSETAAALVTKDILAATQHVHQCGVLHRDIKPEHILISDGRAVLVDFDVACYISQGKDPDLLRAGTPGYFSPEMVLRAPIGTPTDLFSVGCTLFFMFKKKPPFRTSPHNIKAVSRKTAICKLQFDVCFDEVSEACKSLISSLIVRCPSERFSSEQALQHEWLASKGTTGQTSSPGPAGAAVEFDGSKSSWPDSPRSAVSGNLAPRPPSGSPSGPPRPSFHRGSNSGARVSRLSTAEMAAPQRPSGNPLGPARALYRKHASGKAPILPLRTSTSILGR
eukprot:TRINITY_DN5116_c0_g3_i1.p1 TRINITY_DN5116_c0_g3~~TRINITY_DN5116_c0_g3_i1.p1  ORF type:complete len:381 (-),score=45.93 TRINITY_DN5116_c0_g3_i1:478-1620(-)